MEADIVSRVDKLEAELQRLKYLVKAKRLHEYVIEELHRVKAIGKLEIKKRLKKHGLVKKGAFDKMKASVTGCAGFIGSHLVDKL